ncbi:MarC family protein [uncultured Cohaesibacter sp.]|uniref:MarC family protein n=1 Tax=uncultured Cohaesibacter sp. TaxID=1002546 RepID=UPI00293058FB|nr:MarC family protein [uncultured Cohaesibacter sp.]
MLPIDVLLNAFATLFVTIDPIGLAPIFLAITAGASKQERIKIGIRAVIAATGILLTFGLIGQSILQILGISIPAFRIAGGLLLFAIAFEMVFEKREKRKSQSAEQVMSDDEMHDIAIFPLAIPLISGPGAISAVLLLTSQSTGWIGHISILAIVAVVLLLVLVTFVISGWVDKMLGDNGRNILTRLLGVLLAALSVQFIADGVKAVIAGG